MGKKLGEKTPSDGAFRAYKRKVVKDPKDLKDLTKRH